MTDIFVPPGLGWNRDLPDPRDYAPDHASIVESFAGLRIAGSPPEHVDLRDYCTEAEDQGNLATSCAHACLGLLRYFERRACGIDSEPSRLFVYQTTRRLMGLCGDSGACLRTTWKAMARFGVPPERCWQYEPRRLEQEPDAFTYSFDREFRAVAYVRLDHRRDGESVLQTVKSFLAAGLPSVFGFPVFTCLSSTGDIPFPTRRENVRGGQAVVALGYDDQRRIGSDKGALLLRCSWGPRWGEEGYGWLPYSYVRERLAVDFWTLIQREWLLSGEFERPA